MANIDPTTLAYLAGCIDSDGTLTIRRDFKNVRNGRRVGLLDVKVAHSLYREMRFFNSGVVVD